MEETAHLELIDRDKLENLRKIVEKLDEMAILEDELKQLYSKYGVEKI